MESDDSSLEEARAQFMVDLSNNYLAYFKKQNGKSEELNMFDGIDPENESSVNIQLESFYEELVKYKMMNDEDKNIYKYENLQDFKDDDELYSIQADGNQIAVSKSLFSILIELTNLQNENQKKKYDIICFS